MGGEPTQPTQHEGHVGAEHAMVGMRFVNDLRWENACAPSTWEVCASSTWEACASSTT